MRLLERDAEIVRLDELLAEAADGTGRLLVVEGRPGAGKSSLLQETAARAARSGFRCLTARGAPLEGDLSLGLLRQLFAGAAGQARRGRRLSTPADAAAAVLSGDAGAGDLEPAFLMHGLYWLCSDLAEERALLLAVDDAQWGDASSLRWLAFLQARIRALPIAAIVAVRSENLGDRAPLAELLADPHVDRLALGELSQDATTELVRGALGEHAHVRFCAACHRATGGNPFYLSELLGTVRAAGIDAAAANADRVERLVPDVVRREVLRRVDRLGEAARAVAEAVAILQSPAELRHVAALAQVDAADAAAAADALAAVHVLRAGRPLQFAHPVLEASVYEAIAPAGRAMRHRHAASVLAATAAEADRVALHLLHSEPSGDDDAVDWLRVAARRALANAAPATAALYVRRALAEPPRPGERPELLMELALAELRAGDDRGIDHLREAIQSAPPGSLRDRAELRLARWLFHEARPGMDQAIAILDRQAEDRRREDPVGALELESEAVAIAQFVAAPDLDARIARFIARFGAVPRPGRAALGTLACVRAVGAGDAAEAGDLAEAAMGRWLHGHEPGPSSSWPQEMLALVATERFDALDRATRRFVDEGRARGSLSMVAGGLTWRAMLHRRLGRLKDAEADAAAALAARPGEHSFVPAATAVLVESLLEQGRVDEAADTLPERWREDDLPALFSFPALLIARGRIALARRNPEAAFEDFLACGESACRCAARGPGWTAWRSWAAVAAVTLGREEEARRLAEEELSLARAFGAPGALGVALRSMALATRDRAESVGRLEASVAQLERSALGLERLRSLIELGAALRRSKRRTEAREPLRQALDAATRSGALVLAEQARTELAATGAKPRRLVLSGVAALTPSELRVAQLAAVGLSNAQIAQQLFVTKSTVEKHLASAYRKLGAHKREELPAALAEESQPSSGVTV